MSVSYDCNGSISGNPDGNDVWILAEDILSLFQEFRETGERKMLSQRFGVMRALLKYLYECLDKLIVDPVLGRTASRWPQPAGRACACLSSPCGAMGCCWA